MTDITKNIFSRAFDAGKTIDDSTPILSQRHSLFIEGVCVDDDWRELHDAIRSAFIDWTEDGSWDYISPQHEKEYSKIEKSFNKLFLKLNK